MKIEHAAVYVRDLEKMRGFYEMYFDAKVNQKYHNKTTGLQTYFLTFDGEARLELMTRPGIETIPEAEYLFGYTHLAFQLGSKEKVDYVTHELKAAGFTILSGPRTTGDGYYESCFLDPEGNQIELVA